VWAECAAAETCIQCTIAPAELSSSWDEPYRFLFWIARLQPPPTGSQRYCTDVEQEIVLDVSHGILDLAFAFRIRRTAEDRFERTALRIAFEDCPHLIVIYVLVIIKRKTVS